MEKSVAKKLEHHLEKSVAENFGEASSFILGVSGGPDSMALLYLFHKLKLKAHVVHINYGKRGKNSDMDQELVEQIAFQWNFECVTARLDSDKAEGENFQNWARNQRYQIFRDLKHEFNADAIVTAHHQDDQLETILQKILRGSSPSAWKGMQEFDGEIFRPLLHFSKEEIVRFCEEEAVPYRIDESNLEATFARNFIRKEFAEKLNKFFPGWKQNILALEQQAKVFEESIGFIAERVWDGKKIKLKKFSSIPDKLKSAVIKTILESVDENIQLSKGQLQEMAEIEHLQTGKSLEAGAFTLSRNRDEVFIHRTKKATIQTLEISEEAADQGFEAPSLFIQKTKEKEFEWDLKLDASKLQWPLTLRTWKYGDAINPLGMTGTQKIADHLANRKIPSHLKEKALLLCGSDGTIYAIIYPEPAHNLEKGAISELAKCETTTTTFLTIRIK